MDSWRCARLVVDAMRRDGFTLVQLSAFGDDVWRATPGTNELVSRRKGSAQVDIRTGCGLASQSPMIRALVIGLLLYVTADVVNPVVGAFFQFEDQMTVTGARAGGVVKKLPAVEATQRLATPHATVRIPHRTTDLSPRARTLTRALVILPLLSERDDLHACRICVADDDLA